MRESKIEKDVADFSKEQDWLPRKFVSPGNTGVADHLFLKPIPEEHRAIVNQYVKWVEFKAPGKTPGKKQTREHTRLRALGHEVHVIDNIEDGKELFLDAD